MDHIQRGRIADLRRITALTGGDPAGPERAALLARVFHLLPDDRVGQAWLLGSGGDPIGGYALLRWADTATGRHAVLTDLRVREPGRGLGSRALPEVLAAAAVAGAHEVRLQLPSDQARDQAPDQTPGQGSDQARARRFFARLGFSSGGDGWMSRPSTGMAERAARLGRALALGPAMAESLARLEPRVAAYGGHDGVPPIIPATPDRCRAAVTAAWPEVVARAAQTRLSLATGVVAELNAVLCRGAGLPGSEEFRDGTPPSTWTSLLDGLFGSDGWQDLHEWDQLVLPQLTWGGHVPALPLTTAWLLLAGLRVQAGAEPYSPRPDLDDSFLAALRDAGPDLWDAGTLAVLLRRHYP